MCQCQYLTLVIVKVLEVNSKIVTYKRDSVSNLLATSPEKRIEIIKQWVS